MDYSRFKDILVERRADGILCITLNRPDKLNAADAAMHQAFAEIWPMIDRDPDVRVAVITGAGRAFSAGGDLTRVENTFGNYDDIVAILDEARDIVYNILHCSKPIISAINGVAVGAGVVVALLSDISIMAENARLGDGHIRMGVAAGDHGAILWPLLCGMAKAKYYLMTGEMITGREAERIGLVSLCVPDDQVLVKAMEVATRLATGPRDATKFTKRALNQWLLQAGPIFDHSLALEMMGFFSKDLLAGVEGLRNKRPGRFPSNERQPAVDEAPSLPAQDASSAKAAGQGNR
jgi:enoyl-CoA hydratase